MSQEEKLYKKRLFKGIPVNKRKIILVNPCIVVGVWAA